MSKAREESENILPLRPCVGIAVFNKHGQAWAGRRADIVKQAGKSRFGVQNAWQMPQGGIDPHETPLAAAKRELWEETGITSITLLAESAAWLDYELPSAVLAGKDGYKPWGGRYRGQTQKWFAFLFTGEEREITVKTPPAGTIAEFDAWKWWGLTEIAEQAVAFKRPVYRQIALEFAPIAAKLRHSVSG